MIAAEPIARSAPSGENAANPAFTGSSEHVARAGAAEVALALALTVAALVALAAAEALVTLLRLDPHPAAHVIRMVSARASRAGRAPLIPPSRGPLRTTTFTM